MTALATATNSISELLTLVQDRKPWRLHAGMIAMLVIVIASIGSSLSYTIKADHDMDRQFESKLAVYREQAERISQAEQSKNEALALAKQAAVDATLSDVLPRSRALAEVSTATPAGMRLIAISLASDSQSDQSVALPGVARYLRIRGAAVSDAQLSQFLNRLSKSPWVHGVNVLPRTGDAHQFEVAATFAEPEAVR